MMTIGVRTGDGVDLVLYRMDPVAGTVTTAASVLLVHGAFSSHRVWLRGGTDNTGLARYLAASGCDVWLADWRAHGAAAREPRPHAWHFEDTITQDAPVLVDYVRTGTGGAPPVWVGHSVGGAIGLAHLARHPGALAGVVTLGTPGPVMGPLRRSMALGTVALCRMLPRFPARALRMGSEDESALVLAEWMLWNVRGAWRGADGFDYLGALGKSETAVLTVAGEGDRLFAPARACRALARRAGATPAIFSIVGPGLDHPGLLLDPRADQECWPLLSHWIAALPAPAHRPARTSA
jgi:pimeloyl-ACP methyl ester carboxylesterase